MIDPTKSPGTRDRERAWAPYRPTADAPWDLRRVVHLHRRAGFAAPWDRIQRDLKDGPQPSIDRLLEGKLRINRDDEFESTSGVLVEAATGSSEPDRLKAWWIWRMLHTPDPLGERLTLMWHNHFATSNRKVDDLTAMHRQNETFRRLARAPFGELLNAVVRDPALLIWLDARANRKGHPNENLARELMELFTVGIGHFAETDVREAARALTGWSVTDGQFRELASLHDDGPKALLGRRGNWSGKDLVAILLEHPATADRLAWRICGCFMGEGTVGSDALRELGEGLRSHDLDIGWALGTLLRSRAFFEEVNIATQVASPPQLVVGAVAALEIADASTRVLADWVGRVGQDLFDPPNVGGWPGGRGWLGSRNLIARINLVAALIDGGAIGCAEPLNALGLAERHGAGLGPDELLSWFSRLLLGQEPDSDIRDRILASVKSQPPAERARRLVAMILSSPDAQLS
jgi:Protein of unknown function (DUF1800)